MGRRALMAPLCAALLLGPAQAAFRPQAANVEVLRSSDAVCYQTAVTRNGREDQAAQGRAAEALGKLLRSDTRTAKKFVDPQACPYLAVFQFDFDGRTGGYLASLDLYASSMWAPAQRVQLVSLWREQEWGVLAPDLPEEAPTPAPARSSGMSNSRKAPQAPKPAPAAPKATPARDDERFEGLFVRVLGDLTERLGEDLARRPTPDREG